ncbi:MAG: DUF6057 family protein [Verrucomicrobia bacterium]|nr:DUF6057 family protein [Verrucomicrobiota bacterium]
MGKTRHKFPRARAVATSGGAAVERSDRAVPEVEIPGKDVHPSDPAGIVGGTGRAKLGVRLRNTLFFLLFFLYLWLRVDPRLLAHCAAPRSGNLPVFYRGWTFFRECVGHPGGPAEYVGALVFQFLSQSGVGALVVTGLAWTLSRGVSGCFGASGFPRLRCLRYVPVLLVLAIYSQYAHCITDTVALAMAICLIPPYLRVSAISTPAAMVCFLVVSPALYYVAGATYLIFAATCILHGTLVTRQWRLAVFCLLVATAVPCLSGVFFSGVPLTTAFTPGAFSRNLAVSNQTLWAVRLLCLLVPVGMLLAGAATWVRGRPNPTPLAGAGATPAPDQPANRSKRSSPAKAGRNPAAGDPWYARHPELFRVAGWLLPLALAAGAARFTFDAKEKCLRAVDFYADRGMWERVLDAARDDPANPPNILTVDRALCHTGRLADEMFSHPQSIAALLAGTEDTLAWQWTGIWLDAGFVNAAEHHLAQMQEVVGEQPAILEKLALIHLAKGNPGTARIYLHALARTLFRGEWARQRLLDLERDPELAQDAQIQWLRSSMPKTAALIKGHTAAKWFLKLLDRNPKNRPAFEYFMALCLVAARPDQVLENIHRLNQFDYPRPYLPEHYAEAVVFCMANNGVNPDLHGWRIREETRQRFLACMEIARRHKDHRPAMQNELRKKYPASYFRYLLTGESGTP